jgi:Phage integrase family
VQQAVNMAPLGWVLSARGGAGDQGSNRTGLPGEGGNGDPNRNPADDPAPGDKGGGGRAGVRQFECRIQPGSTRCGHTPSKAYSGQNRIWRRRKASAGLAVEDDIPAGKQAKKLPVVISQDEVARFLAAVDNLKHRVILTVWYATGLRISEAVRLTPDAIDSERMVIRVAQGKGRKDRYVMLPPRLLELLRDYWKRTRPGAWLFPGDRPD